jgi:hypothetical protein
MVRTESRRRNLAEIGKFRFQTLNIQPDSAAAGESQRHDAGRRIVFGKFDGQQIEPRIPVALVEIAAFAAVDALEAQSRAAAPVVRVGACFGVDRAHPVEAVERHHEAVLARQPENVGDPDQGVLHMRRHHFNVILVEGDEFKFVNARIHP